MKQLISFVAEFIRAFFIIFIGTAFLNLIENYLFLIMGIDIEESVSWMLTAANILIIFVIYRNKLQSKGWYKSHQNKPFSRLVSWAVLGTSFILLLLAAVL